MGVGAHGGAPLHDNGFFNFALITTRPATTGKVEPQSPFNHGWIVYQFGVQEPGFGTPAQADDQIHSLFRPSNGFRPVDSGLRRKDES